MKSKKLFLSVLAASLAGFLFGFDTIVISGADQPIQKLWNLGDWFHGTFIMSMALWGTVIGALGGGIPCDKLGRKATMFWIGVFFLASALGSALAPDPYTFSFSRFIGGLGVGASSVAVPVYLSEITPSNNRGWLTASYQFNLVVGILVAYISNYLIGLYIDAGAWRWMMGVEVLPAAVYVLLVLGVPNSPRWMALRQGDEEKAWDILNELNPGENIDALLDEITASKERASLSEFLTRKFSYPIALAFLIAFFNQLSGINFVLYYAPRIIQQAGLAETAVLGASVPIGIVNLAFTILGMILIDRAGRKLLMYVGSVGYITSLIGVSWAFYTEAQGVLVVAFVCAFIASHAIGQGAVIWVFISEIFPNNVRDYGMSLGSGTHWVCAALITLITPTVLATYAPETIFAFFAGMMVLQLLFVAFMMPETKNRTLEELEKELMPADAGAVE